MGFGGGISWTVCNNEIITLLVICTKNLIAAELQ